VVDNSVIKRPPSSKYRNGKRRIRGQQHHLCLDKGYNSENEEQELLKRGYVLHIPIRKEKKGTNNEKYVSRPIPNIKKYSPIRGRLYSEPTPGITDLENCLLVIRKRSENYLGLVQFSCCIIIYRKIILGKALSTDKR
jgi:hypothetical protein